LKGINELLEQNKKTAKLYQQQIESLKGLWDENKKALDMISPDLSNKIQEMAKNGVNAQEIINTVTKDLNNGGQGINNK
jgi:hypothetical protein